VKKEFCVLLSYSFRAWKRRSIETGKRKHKDNGIQRENNKPKKRGNANCFLVQTKQSVRQQEKRGIEKKSEKMNE